MWHLRRECQISSLFQTWTIRIWYSRQDNASLACSTFLIQLLSNQESPTSYILASGYLCAQMTPSKTLSKFTRALLSPALCMIQLWLQKYGLYWTARFLQITCPLAVHTLFRFRRPTHRTSHGQLRKRFGYSLRPRLFRLLWSKAAIGYSPLITLSRLQQSIIRTLQRQHLSGTA